MFRFKFQKIRTLNKEYDFFEGWEEEEPLEVRETRFINFNLNYYWQIYGNVQFEI